MPWFHKPFGVYILILVFSPLVVKSDCPDDCYTQWQQGNCNSTTDSCDCNPVYIGADCSISNATALWDNLNCHGGRFFPPADAWVAAPGLYRYCVCPLGWLGTDCSVCANDYGCSSANQGSTCEKSMYVTSKKFYNCTVSDPVILSLFELDHPGANAWASFPPNQTTGGSAGLTFYQATTGAPWLFVCNFTSCTSTIDATGLLTINCDYTRCNVSDWASQYITQYIKKAYSTMAFTCTSDGNCQWSQKELEDTFPYIGLYCTAGECLVSKYAIYKSPPTTYLRIISTVAIGLGIFLAFGLGSIGTFHIIKPSKRYHLPKYNNISLSFQNVSCAIPQNDSKRVILHSVSGVIQPGNITAIIGASGAGKTTFLDVLAGRKNTGYVNGKVLLNGTPREMKSFKRLAGYVMQDDVFMGTLTVYEYLSSIARLRLPSSMPFDQKMDRVDNSLKELNIYHIKDTRIGTDTSRGISGGERKRLAIAAELVIDPSILMLDEPTSGLDSYSASMLMKTLHDLAHGARARTIILSIHQPRSDIFNLFDYLMVFSRGKLAYNGPASGALLHFAHLGYECPPNFNPTDFIIDTISLPTFKEPVLAESTMQLNINSMKEEPPVVDEFASSFATQFRVLTKRTLLQSLRNPFLLRAQYAVFIVVGLMLGFLYWHVSDDLSHGGMQNRMGSLFFLVCLLSFGSITSIDLFFSERLLFLRERANGAYRTSAYFFAKAVSDLIPMRFIPPIVLGSIVYYMIGFQQDPIKFAIFLLFLVMVSMASTSMCFLISAMTPSIAIGNFVAILLLFFFLLFGGFLVSLNSMPWFVKWITNLSFIKFSYIGLMINEFDGISILINPGDMGDKDPIWVSGEVVLDQVGISVDMLYPSIGALFGLLIFFLLGTYFALRYVVKEKR